MKQFLLYFIQVIISSGILYGFYHFVLRNTLFHKYNRYYLLASVLLSVFVPFLNIPIYFSGNNHTTNGIVNTIFYFGMDQGNEAVVSINKSTTKVDGFNWSQILLIAYIFITLLAFLRMIVSLIKITNLKRKYPVEKIDSISFYKTNEPGTPFSFFNALFWNNKIELHSPKGQQIFRHEIFHIRQLHTVDVLFLEMVSALFWINPFFHLIKKETKAIHEFLADEFAIQSSDKWQYAELLLMQALQTRHSIVNPFFHNQIKRRIAMIQNSTTTGKQYLRKLLTLPALAIVLALFAFNYKARRNEKQQLQVSTVTDTLPKNLSGTKLLIDKENEFTIKSDSIVIKDNENTKDIDFKEALIIVNGNRVLYQDFIKKTYTAGIMTIYPKNDAEAIKLYGADAVNGVIEMKAVRIINNSASTTKIDTEAGFPGGDVAWRKYLTQNLNAATPVENGAPSGKYTVMILFQIDADGSVKDIKAITNHGYGMEKEAIRIIKKGPKWVPANQGGVNVSSYRKQPLTFVVTSSSASDKKDFNNISNLITQLEGNTPPQFPGGTAAWREFLVKNLNANIPVDSGASKGTYKTEVQFIVDAAGNISNITPKTKWGHGMEQEVVRLLKQSPKWIPAKENGKAVLAYTQVPVTFVVVEDNAPVTKNNN
ncbi:MAG: energy transducer TonB [Chitinophagaceae bacterium]|jgi:beta-lactamase regulating signal transducer with metallopeptidase domain|nr:energy transducer TonB [Chitinophagaceae bacterium]HRF23464.1 M56 family metallopeptidase [Chitinophagaceae bacterium]